MNKSLNTILFIIGASIAVTLVSLLIIIIPNLLLLLIMGEAAFSKIATISFAIALLGAIVGSFVIYAKVMKTLSEKVDLGKYFSSWLIKKKTDL